MVNMYYYSAAVRLRCVEQARGAIVGSAPYPTEEEIIFYGIDGRKLETFRRALSGSYAEPQAEDVYFAGTQIVAENRRVMTDRLGRCAGTAPGSGTTTTRMEKSARARRTTGRSSGPTSGMGTGNYDYADQRYYANNQGRFLTPDPYSAGSGGEFPQSLNMYAYVEGDPVNFGDPTGENLAFDQPADLMGGGGGGGGIPTNCRVFGFLPVPNALCYILPVIAWPSQTKAKPPDCFARLKYRDVQWPSAAVDITPANHSFWWVQDSTGARYISQPDPRRTRQPLSAAKLLNPSTLKLGLSAVILIKRARIQLELLSRGPAVFPLRTATESTGYSAAPVTFHAIVSHTILPKGRTQTVPPGISVSRLVTILPGRPVPLVGTHLSPFRSTEVMRETEI